MSTFKKVISLVLCVAMLAGTFAIAGDLAAPVASAAEEVEVGAKPRVIDTAAKSTALDATGIISYDDLVASYGTATGADGLTDGFLYVATEYYEKDGRPTDYYVKPGDKLTAKVYIKSNMKTGDGYIISFYNNSHWDVKIVSDGATTDKNGYTSNYSGGEVNPNHPAIVTNGYGCTITSINITNVGWIKNTCGLDTKYLAATDLVQTNTVTNIDVGTPAYQMTSDEWVYTYYVTVKEGLEDGTELVVESPDVIWHSYINPATSKHDFRKKAYVGCGHITNNAVTDTTNVKTMASQMDSGALDYFINGLDHTFVIGEPKEETKYIVEFCENNGEMIGEAAEYAEGEEAVFPAAAENQIAWAIVKEGMETPGTLLEPDADGNYSYTVKAMDAKFMRVLADDTYDVELALGADVTVDETKLPEGVTYNAEKKALVIALPVGGSFDLATIPADALSKKDNEFVEWDVTGVTGVSTVEGTVLTLGNINGEQGTKVTAKLSATWETATYNIRFFLNKEAYENGEDPIKVDTVVAGGSYTYAVDSLVADKKFAGWYTADTNELVNDKKPVINKYSYSRDMDFYADWSEYANMATFMVRDYANGEGWVTAYVDKSDVEGEKTIAKLALKTIKDNAVNAMGANFVQILDMDPDLIPEGETMRDHIVAPAYGDGSFVNDLVYSGHKVYYIVTTLDYSVTWKVPVYDAEAKDFVEGEYTEYPVTVSTAYTPTNGLDPYFAVSKFNTESITHPTGWEISGWIDEATGEAAELNENGQYVIQGLENKSATLVAVYSLIEYPVAFNLKNGASPDVVTMVGTVKLGESIIIDGAEFTLNGEKTVLPVVDVENSEQPDGGYILPDGYIFKGWTLGSGENLVDAEFPVTLTETHIKTNLIRGAIQFSAKWEAKEFNLKFYIINAAGEEELYGEHKVKVGDNLAAYKEVTAEKSADINAKAPEGKAFSNVWINKETGASDTMTKMPAKDVTYIASYVSATIKVYIDYNHLETADLSQSMKEFKEASLIYGQDITEIKSEAPYFERSFETVVKRSHMSTQPVDPSEVIGWNIYHVAAGADPYTAEWKSGVNDAGTNIAATTLIFQPIWMAHKDMLFRAYDTDDNIYLALGKNLKLYFWNSGNIVDSIGDTQYNTNPELNVVLFFTMELENWNWSEFFNIDMWSSLTLRFDAFPIPKSVFTIEGMIGIFQMLGNLIGSLF